MASAGRILIMPKGDYDASITYEMLDLVHHNGTAWLARKSVVGIEPSNANSEHWFKFAVINSQDYLSINGGVLKGNLGLGEGKGVVYAVDVGTILTAKKDSNNYRDVRVGNPEKATQPNDFLKMIDCKDGVVTDYKIFGEHNIALLETHIAYKANGGTMQFTANPNGNNYVIHRFNLENLNDVVFFGNILASETVFVAGVNIVNFQPSYVEVKFWLNQAYNGELTFAAGYLKALK